MPTPKQQRRRALELLETSIDGCTEAIMLAYGFKTELLVELVNAGLATASIEGTVAGTRRIEVTRMRITAAGRRALTKLRWPCSSSARPWAAYSRLGRADLGPDVHPARERGADVPGEARPSDLTATDQGQTPVSN